MWNEINQKIFDEVRQLLWVGEEKKDDDDSDDEVVINKVWVWDDWKDDNLRGVGNKKFMFCG